MKNKISKKACHDVRVMGVRHILGCTSDYFVTGRHDTIR